MITKLYFRYSDIYDQTLARIAKEDFDYGKAQWKSDVVNKYSKYWGPYNDVIFEYYQSIGLTFPDYWIAYFVEKKNNLVPFSDPLTIIINDNFELTTATLVHELCHSLFIYHANQNVWNAAYSKVNEKFANEDFLTKVHLIVVIFTYYGLTQIYDSKKVADLLAVEKSYEGLKRTWEILDQNTELFKNPDPQSALNTLVG